MVPRKFACRYIEAFQIQTNAPKSLKYGLKLSQEDTLEGPWFPQICFFQNWGVGVLNFSLLVNNGTLKVAGRVYLAPCTLISKKLSHDIKDREEYRLVNTLSHILTFLVQKSGFGKPLCTRPPTSGLPFLTDKKKLRVPTSQFWKKCRFMGCRGSHFFLISQKWYPAVAGRIFLETFQAIFEPFWCISLDLGSLYIPARHLRGTIFDW